MIELVLAGLMVLAAIVLVTASIVVSARQRRWLKTPDPDPWVKRRLY
jgi:hypothetical protein